MSDVARARRTSISVSPAAPGWLVVFREPCGRNAGLISQVLGVGQASGPPPRPGTVALRARSGAAPPRVYERLGVAVCDLGADQRRRLLRDDRVIAVEGNERARPAALVRAQGADPDAAGPHSWCLDMIGVGHGHGLTGRGVPVAVLDTGIDRRHPDLGPRLDADWECRSFVPGEDAADDYGHGTHCAGIVAGPAVSVGGTRYGVAPGVRLLAGKVLSDTGMAQTDWILDGIDWAAERGARVISLSCILPRGRGEGYSIVYERVARTLLDGHPGVLLLAAAGNASARPWHTRAVDNPAACPSILSVAALNRACAVASFSGCQLDEIGEVNLAAPGACVYSAWKGGFRVTSGTSMAAPHVAGVAALCLEQDPQLSARALWDRLAASARPLADRRDAGAGLVQAPALEAPERV